VVGVAVFVAPSSSAAEDPSPSGAGPDRIVLRDGTEERGRITELIPGNHATIVGDGGETKRIPWTMIERVISSNKGGGAPIAGAGGTVESTPTDAPAPSSGPPPTRDRWHANRSLLSIGGALFLAGYAPTFGAALPSAAGVWIKVLIAAGTAGLYFWGKCTVDRTSYDGDGRSYVDTKTRYRADANYNYLCDSTHGSVQLLIPVAGPILFANNDPRDTFLNERGRPLGDVAKALLYASAGLQAAGLVVMLGAVAAGKREPVRPSTGNAGPAFFVFPTADATTFGLTIGARRW
jgi:hypothetical protein